MKILIYTPFWKRPEIVREYVKSVERLKKVSWIDVRIMAIVSPEDPDFRKIVDSIHELRKRFKYVSIFPTRNTPLGAKKNAGLWLATSYDWDYLLELNSDSIVNCRLLDIYKPYMDKGVPFFGLKDLYVVDYATKETLFIPDYNSGMTYGAGRMMHRSIIRGRMWNDELNEGLDDNCRAGLEKRGIPDCPIETDKPMLVELKTHTTINHFTMLKALGNRRNQPKAQVIDYNKVSHVVSP